MLNILRSLPHNSAKKDLLILTACLFCVYDLQSCLAVLKIIFFLSSNADFHDIERSITLICPKLFSNSWSQNLFQRKALKTFMYWIIHEQNEYLWLDKNSLHTWIHSSIKNLKDENNNLSDKNMHLLISYNYYELGCSLC